jgi:hypothetical protein
VAQPETAHLTQKSVVYSRRFPLGAPDALDRKQPILPLRQGIPEQQTHEYIRHGTCLFAALEVATGKITADACYPRHTNAELLASLKRVDRARYGQAGSTGSVPDVVAKKRTPRSCCALPRPSAVEELNMVRFRAQPRAGDANTMFEEARDRGTVRLRRCEPLAVGRKGGRSWRDR